MSLYCVEEAPDLAWRLAMERGDFAAAWRETDRAEIPRRRLEREGRFIWNPDYLLWNGEPFYGRRVLVRCNHGLGDTLQFIRFIPRICAMAEAVTVFAQPPLVELLCADGRFGDVRDGWIEEAPDRDVEVEIMELAYAFRCTPETVPRAPYLSAPRADVMLEPDPAAILEIGLLWAASDWDVSRSIPLPLFDALAGLPGVRFHSLQQGAQAEEWRDSRLPLQPLSEQTGEITAAAAAMQQLDLIITMDGMAAHLAGALGRPVWLLLQHEADWRWMKHREDSPWYPNMRIFRQPAPGAWKPVLSQVRAELSTLLATAAGARGHWYNAPAHSRRRAIRC